MILRGYTVFGHCNHLGHLTRIMFNYFCFHVPWSDFWEKACFNFHMLMTFGQGQGAYLNYKLNYKPLAQWAKNVRLTSRKTCEILCILYGGFWWLFLRVLSFNFWHKDTSADHPTMTSMLNNYRIFIHSGCANVTYGFETGVQSGYCDC